MRQIVHAQQAAQHTAPRDAATDRSTAIEIEIGNRSAAMKFKNEYVPPLGQETSEFFKQAQKTLHVAAESRSKWTVDREREMVLVYEGSGREIESANHGLWSYIDNKGYCVFSTERLSKIEVSSEELAITYRLKGFWEGDRYSTPDTTSLACIKEALREYKDWGVVSDYKQCQLTLIDGRTGEEI